MRLALQRWLKGGDPPIVEVPWLDAKIDEDLPVMHGRRKKLFRPWQKRWLEPGNVLKMLSRNGVRGCEG